MSEPLIDVVIPVHDNLPWLRMCLTALHAFTANPYRVLIVDNASETEEAKDFLRPWRADDCLRDNYRTFGLVRDDVNVDVVRLGSNDSFSASVNAGVRAGKAPNVVILNSDVIVSKGWDQAFLADLAHQDVGLTGARCAPTTAIGVQADPASSARHAGPSLAPQVQGRLVDSVSAPFLVFFCVAFRREVFDRIGPLDGETCRGWGGGEDLDWSWRVEDAGLRCVVSAAHVTHGCSQTYAAQGWAVEAKAKAERANLEALVRKHGEDRLRRATRARPTAMVATFHRGDVQWNVFADSMLRALTGVIRGGYDVVFAKSTRTLVDLARNLTAKLAVERSARRWGQGAGELDYLIMCDDDHVFGEDAFVRLLTANKPIVGAWAYRRKVNVLDPTRADHTSCVFRWHDPRDPTKGCESIEGLEHTGLQRVDAIGFGLVAIRLDVLRTLLKLEEGKPRGAVFEFKELGEDMGFCAKAGAAGYEVWVDTDLVIGHLGEPVLVDEAYARRWQQQASAAGGVSR